VLLLLLPGPSVACVIAAAVAVANQRESSHTATQLIG